MTPKISLIIGIVAAALVLAAPAAAMYPTLDGGDIGNNRGDAAVVLFDNYKAEGQQPGRTSAAPTASGDTYWSELGVGFGLGIVLVLGIGAALRVAQVRPLAH
jgi:hypothetical protein